MLRSFRSPSMQQNEPAGDAQTVPDGGDLSVAPSALGTTAQSDRRPKSTLKDRIQAGSANFNFDMLLHGVVTLQAIPTAVNARDGAELIWIPAGSFMMGSDEGERCEQPIHRVCLDGFWIYKLPVTVAQYRRFYTEIGRSLRTEPPWGWRDRDPIVNVNWEYANSYAQWAGAALPTEAEWERAARGEDGWRYPWGSTWDPEMCSNSVGRRRPSVAPAGNHPRGATARGIMDMAGNVWEWTADWFDPTYYVISPEANPTGPASGAHRVVRGGSWGNDLPHDYRTTTRVVCDPAVRGATIGFRCVVHTDMLAAPQS